MKRRKQIKRIIFISLIIMVLIGVFTTSYGFSIGDVAEFGLKNNPVAWGVKGIAYVLIIALQELALLLFGALRLLTAAITGVNSDSYAATIGNIVFNKCGLTSANFFPEVWVGGKIQYSGETIDVIFQNIRQYYYIIRNFSIAILLLILLYIGIRMAISTVASEEAKYKKMLKDWVISLVLLFVLHYIIIITFFVNNVLVEALSKVGGYNDMSFGLSNFAELAVDAAKPGIGLTYVIVYGSFVVGTLAFAIMYIKRTIVLGFLIVIAPLITITYAIDKMGDGKSQALNAWMKEFIFTVIIQPFHCVIYLVFYASIMGVIENEQDIGAMIFASACAFFMLKAENIVRKIFGVQPNSIGNAIGAGAMALSVTSGLFKGGSKNKLKGNMKDMKNNNTTDRGTTSNNDSQSGATRDSETSRTQNATNNAVNQSNNENSSQTSTAASSGADNGSSTTITPNRTSQTSSAKGNKGFSFADTLDKINNNRLVKMAGGPGGIAKRYISGAATLAGFIAGATTGDFKDAMTIGSTSGNAARAAGDKASYLHAEQKLYNNQRVFAGAYNDFAEAYRDKYGDVDDEIIIAAAKSLYETGGEGLKDEYEIDMYKQMKNLADNAEVLDYDDGFEYVEHSLRLAAEGAIEPTSDYVRKVYSSFDNVESSSGQTSNQNTNQNTNQNRRRRQRTTNQNTTNPRVTPNNGQDNNNGADSAAKKDNQ